MRKSYILYHLQIRCVIEIDTSNLEIKIIDPLLFLSNVTIKILHSSCRQQTLQAAISVKPDERDKDVPIARDRYHVRVYRLHQR